MILTSAHSGIHWVHEQSPEGFQSSDQSKKASTPSECMVDWILPQAPASGASSIALFLPPLLQFYVFTACALGHKEIEAYIPQFIIQYYTYMYIYSGIYIYIFLGSIFI